MSLCRAFLKTGIEFPHGVGILRIAKQSTITQPKRFFEVPYHEQYESRDNESKNRTAKWVHEQYPSLDLRVLDDKRRKNTLFCVYIMIKQIIRSLLTKRVSLKT